MSMDDEKLIENESMGEDQSQETENTETSSEENKEVKQKSEEQQQKNRGNLQAALSEERTERKRAQAQLRDAMAKQEIVNKRLAQLFSGEEETSREVDFNEDPATHLKRKTDALENDTKEFKQFVTQQKQISEVSSFASNQVSEFKKEAPDYDSAYEYIRSERIGELMAIYDCSETDAAKRANQEELNFTIACAQEGRNPAKSLYNYAKRRGYTGSNESQNGGEKRLETIQRGITATKSLSSSSGKSPNTLTAESLAAMSEEDFSEFKKKNPKKFREIMGAA